MAWVAVDMSGTECIFDNKPERNNNQWDDIVYSLYERLPYQTTIILFKDKMKGQLTMNGIITS